MDGTGTSVPEIDVSVGAGSSDTWGLVLVVIAVVVAVIYLARMFASSRKGCCSGCSGAGGCEAMKLAGTGNLETKSDLSSQQAGDGGIKPEVQRPMP